MTQKIVTATNPNNRFPISSNILTSNCFLGNRVIYFRDCAPKQHIHLEFNHNIKTNNLVSTPYHDIEGRYTAFYVPYAMIWTKFNEFIANAARDSTAVISCPQMTDGRAP